jgi:hypothetical protein
LAVVLPRAIAVRWRSFQNELDRRRRSDHSYAIEDGT